MSMFRTNGENLKLGRTMNLKDVEESENNSRGGVDSSNNHGMMRSKLSRWEED